MDFPMSIPSETWASLNERLEALKKINLPTPDNQQDFGDGELNKIMDRTLYEATEKGDADKFIDALKEVSDTRKLALSLIFEQVTPAGNSLLHVAASSGSKVVMELILFHCPHLVTWKNSSEDTPLHVALQHRALYYGMYREIEMMIRLLTGPGTDLEVIYSKNKDNKSPLYLAAETGKIKIFRCLLQALEALEVSARDEDYTIKIQGMSPVFAALQLRRQDILKEIMSRLPKLLHAYDEDGRTPLHCAASVGNVGAVQLLLEKCPHLALQTDQNGSYPIHVACEGSSLQIISKLLEYTWDLAEIKNGRGQNVFHVAAQAGNSKAVQYILLHCNESVIRKLVSSKDADGNSPLHLASMHIHCPVLISLKMHMGPSDLKLLNNKKLTALDVAMESESSSTKRSQLLARAILIAAGAPRSIGRDHLSSREESSGKSKSYRAEWIKDQVNTRLVVATLVATVTFAAGFTLPGGYNASSDPSPGSAIMLHHGVFQLFVISNMLAMYSSVLAVVFLLWGHVPDVYIAELAILPAGPLLLLALTLMTVAFMAAVILAVRELTWLAKLVLYVAPVFLVMLVLVLATLVFPFSRTATRVLSLLYLVLVHPGIAVHQLRERRVVYPSLVHKIWEFMVLTMNEAYFKTRDKFRNRNRFDNESNIV